LSHEDRAQRTFTYGETNIGSSPPAR
jgi:hypothetical protein